MIAVAVTIEFAARSNPDSRHFIEYEWRQNLCRTDILNCGAPYRGADPNKRERIVTKIVCGCVVSLLLVMPGLSFAEEGASTPKSTPTAGYPTVSMFELIDRVAKKTGKRFVVDPRANMQVPLPGLDAKDVDYQALLAIFRLHSVVTFTQDGITNVLPDANARQMPTPVLTADDPKTGADELVTRVVRLENVCTNYLVPVLRPLMPQAAHMASHQPSNSLILSDRAANVKRIVEVLKLLDRGPRQTCKLPED